MMTAPSASVRACLNQWRDKLIDLSRRNPLLYLRPTKTSFLTVSHPGAEELFDRLVRQGKSWQFWMPPVDEEAEDEEADAPHPPWDLESLQPRGSELVCADHGRRRLLRILTNLYRRAHTDYLERGLRVLHLACGVLEWRDPERGETARSPLVLVPVELARSSLR